MSGTIELVVVDRAGQRLAIPADRVALIGELPREHRAMPLQERLGQPPLAPGERCVAIAVRTADGHTIVPVAGRVTIAEVAAAELSPLPPLFAGARLVTAVVFGAGGSMLVLDPDAVIAPGGGRP